VSGWHIGRTGHVAWLVPARVLRHALSKPQLRVNHGVVGIDKNLVVVSIELIKVRRLRGLLLYAWFKTAVL
jgi:hypothetical protein